MSMASATDASNGKKFGVALNPNKERLSNRERLAEELRLHVSRSLKEGWGQRLEAHLDLDGFNRRM